MLRHAWATFVQNETKQFCKKRVTGQNFANLESRKQKLCPQQITTWQILSVDGVPHLYAYLEDLLGRKFLLRKGARRAIQEVRFAVQQNVVESAPHLTAQEPCERGELGRVGLDVELASAHRPDVSKVHKPHKPCNGIMHGEMRHCHFVTSMGAELSHVFIHNCSRSCNHPW